MPLHYASYCASFYTKYARPYTRTEDFLLFFFFFFTRNKNCHRHVDRFGDVPFISLVCNRPRSFKKYFPYNKQLGEKRETFTNTKTCKGTCGSCTLVSHSSQIFLKKLIGTDFFGQMISFTQPWRFSFSA